MNRIALVLCILITGISAAQTGQKADSLISLMSLEEKVYMVTGTGMDIPGVPENSEPIQATVGTTKDKVPGAAGTSYSIERLGIPAVVFADGPAGIRIDPKRDEAPDQSFYATAFPTAITISSSWNTELVKKVGMAFGIEGKHYGIDFLLAPALNIHRNPLGGRNFEYYSEDPLLSGTIAGYFVKGVQSQGIGATLKHFVANNSETNRTALNTVVSKRALREIYLKGFRVAMKIEQPWAVMSSYNKINGIYASENTALLIDLLRNEWNFSGFVMTDWFGGRDPIQQMAAGNDLLMPGTPQQNSAILEAVKSGVLSEEILDRNIRNILNQYFKTPSFNGSKPTNTPPLEQHKGIARQAATEGMVLLKNMNTLPIQNGTKIALFGNTSYATISGGTGSGDVNKAYMVSIEEGLENAGFAVNRELAQEYTSYIKSEEQNMPPKEFWFAPDRLIREMPLTQEDINRMAENNDMGIYTLGRTSGEFQDRNIEGDYLITPKEKELITSLAEAFHSRSKKFVVILNIGGVMETQSWKSIPDAILLAWQPGQEGGNSIADLLSGAVTPSGKLPVTFPVSLEDVPSSENFPGTVLDPNAPKPENPMMAQESREIYKEDIYIGYRYFDTFREEVSYPFGYGLSYTQFDYQDISIRKNGDTINIDLTISNTGTYQGKEVVQVYVKSPEADSRGPLKELEAFTKTTLLQPGGSQDITLSIPIDELGYFDARENSWKTDEGTYSVLICTDVNTIIHEKSFELPSMIILKTKDILSPEKPLETLKK
ncbi:beta-glucosidase [Robertkochia flava]|uniref:beta-glucosidase n=1 Tax=Robertkochia flava TaxID=3447986 RepID=UPI001CC9F976|nr:glycoside hydrolase family 3 C-terminal domain-containing protein [Robertkochia marina]